MFGFRFPENFRWPYIAHERPGVLAALAHVAVDVVPRLPLHPARRQPRQSTARTLRESRHRLFPVRPVARRELELRDLGPVPRASSSSSNVSSWARRRSAPRPQARADPARVRAADGDGRLGVLPGRHAPARGGLLEGNGWLGRGRAVSARARGGISTRRRCWRSSSGWRDRRRPSRVWRRTVDGRPLTIGRPALVALLLVVCSMFIAARTYNPFIYFRF